MRAVIDALQALRGVSKLTATTLVAEVGELSRFDRASQLMGYSGAVPSTSTRAGGKTRRGRAITKTGNSHLRRVLIEAAWTTTGTVRESTERFEHDKKPSKGNP